MNQQEKYRFNFTSIFTRNKPNPTEREIKRREALRRYTDQVNQMYTTMHINYGGVYSSPVILEEKVVEKPKQEEITLTSESQSAYTLRTKAQGNLAYIFRDPTGNCQIQSVAMFNNIIKGREKKDILDILAKLWSDTASKTELLVDLEEVYTPKMHTLFNDKEILVKAPYVNNTGSKMVLWLVQIQYMLEREGLIND